MLKSYFEENHEIYIVQVISEFTNEEIFCMCHASGRLDVNIKGRKNVLTSLTGSPEGTASLRWL